MKKKILLVVAAFFVMEACAGELNAVKLWKTDGSCEVFLFADRPVATLAGDSMVISTKSISVCYPWQSCSKFTFENHEAGSDGVDNPSEGTTIVAFTEKGLSVAGVSPESCVYVHDIQGRLLFQGQSDADGFIEVEMGITDRVVIVKTECSTFKVTGK